MAKGIAHQGSGEGLKGAVEGQGVALDKQGAPLPVMAARRARVSWSCTSKKGLVEGQQGLFPGINHVGERTWT